MTSRSTFPLHSSRTHDKYWYKFIAHTVLGRMTSTTESSLHGRLPLAVGHMTSSSTKLLHNISSKAHDKPSSSQGSV